MYTIIQEFTNSKGVYFCVMQKDNMLKGERYDSIKKQQLLEMKIDSEKDFQEQVNEMMMKLFSL